GAVCGKLIDGNRHLLRDPVAEQARHVLDRDAGEDLIDLLELRILFELSVLAEHAEESAPARIARVHLDETGARGELDLIRFVRLAVPRAVDAVRRAGRPLRDWLAERCHVLTLRRRADAAVFVTDDDFHGI